MITERVHVGVAIDARSAPRLSSRAATRRMELTEEAPPAVVASATCGAEEAASSASSTRGVKGPQGKRRGFARMSSDEEAINAAARTESAGAGSGRTVASEVACCLCGFLSMLLVGGATLQGLAFFDELEAAAAAAAAGEQPAPVRLSPPAWSQAAPPTRGPPPPAPPLPRELLLSSTPPRGPPPPAPPTPSPPPRMPPPPPLPSLHPPPITPPSPHNAATAQDVVDELNRRFANGHPTNNWNEAGVLFHAFDAVDGYGGHLDLWNGCRGSSTWCFQLDRFSSSLLNHRLPHYFNQYFSEITGAPKGGFIVSTAIASNGGVRCMFAMDAGTLSSSGCPSGNCEGCQLDGSCGNWCWYRGDQLKLLLQMHERRAADGTGCGQATCDYNEIIVDYDTWVSHLPQIIRAIFFPAGEAEAEALSRRVHAAFVETFPQAAASTPLVSFDGERRHPFRLVA